MAANVTDKFKKVGASTVTTLAAPGKALAATSINVGSTTNYPTDTGIVIAIRVVDSNGELVAGTYTEWRATVSSGTSLAIEATPVLGSDQVYAAGTTTQVYIPASKNAQNELIDGILAEHKQDGTHDDVTATSVSTDTITEKTSAAGVTIDGLLVKDSKLATNDSVVTANITDASVTNAKLATATGEPGGAWTTYTPTLSGRLNDSKWTKTCSYKQVGKTVFYKISLVASNATPMDGGSAEAIVSLPVTSINWGSPINIGNVRILDSGTAAYYGHAEWASTSTINVRVSNAAGTYITPTVITSTVPFTWTTSDEIQIIGFYEAA